MLQALSWGTLLAVLLSAHVSVMCLPDVAVHQMADLIAQSRSCYHFVGALFPPQMLIPWTASRCTWHHNMLHVRWQVLFTSLAQPVRHNFDNFFQKITDIFQCTSCWPLIKVYTIEHLSPWKSPPQFCPDAFLVVAFALAWLVRQLRACCCCIGMVQCFDTAGALGWGKAAQMLQAPCLQVGGRLGPAVGSHCQALISTLDRLHQTNCVASQSYPATCQHDRYASSRLIP